MKITYVKICLPLVSIYSVTVSCNRIIKHCAAVECARFYAFALCKVARVNRIHCIHTHSIMGHVTLICVIYKHIHIYSLFEHMCFSTKCSKYILDRTHRSTIYLTTRFMRVS